MVVDAKGRAYVGNFGFDLMSGESFRSASLVMVDVGGSTTVVAEDLKFPNGAVITPDGKTLIVDETFGIGSRRSTSPRTARSENAEIGRAGADARQ